MNMNINAFGLVISFDDCFMFGVEGKSMRLIRTMSTSKVNESKLLKWIRFVMCCFPFIGMCLCVHECVYLYEFGSNLWAKGREKHFPIMAENSTAKQKLKQNEESYLCCHGYLTLFNPLFSMVFGIGVTEIDSHSLHRISNWINWKCDLDCCIQLIRPPDPQQKLCRPKISIIFHWFRTNKRIL